MTLLQTVLRATNFRGNPLLSNIAPAALAVFGVQFIVGIPSVLLGSDFLYDLSGGCAFLGALATSLLLPPLRRDASSFSAGLSEVLESSDWRQLAIPGAVTLYAVRCMSYYLSIVIITRD